MIQSESIKWHAGQPWSRSKITSKQEGRQPAAECVSQCRMVSAATAQKNDPVWLHLGCKWRQQDSDASAHATVRRPTQLHDGVSLTSDHASMKPLSSYLMSMELAL